jgi:hypothetical protein
MRCKETTPSDHNVWLTEMKNKCDQMFLNEGRHAAVYGKLQFTWNRGPVEIECWRVYETYYGCGMYCLTFDSFVTHTHTHTHTQVH